MKHYKKWLGLLWVTIIVIGLLSMFSYLHSHNMSLKDWFLISQETITKILMHLGIFAPIVYILIYVICPLILFPSSILTPLSAIIFGPYLAWVYTYIGENIAASVAFLVARYFGKGFISRFKKLHIIEEELHNHGLRTVLFLRLVPLFPFDVVNFGLGVTKVSYRNYLLGTALGVIPGLTAYIFLGASLLSGMYIIPTVIAFIVISLLANIFRKKNKEVVSKLL